LRRHLAELTRTLNRAPFPLDDDTLHPSAGACTNCPLTTLAAPLLFAHQGDEPPAAIKDARCLNRTCWNEKCHRSAERTATKLRAEHPDLLLVAPREVLPEEIPAGWRSGSLLLPAHAYEKVKKNSDGAQAAMLAGGTQAGRLVWVKPTYPTRATRLPHPDIPASNPPTSEPAASSSSSSDILAERRAKHMNRRIARLAERTRELLEATDGKALSVRTLIALAHVFGTNQSRKGIWQYGCTPDPWDDFDSFHALSEEEAGAEIWTCQLRPVLVSRLQYCGPNDTGRLHKEILDALKLIGASFPDLYLTVARELPEPKAWATLPGYEPEDLSAEPPAPVMNLRSFEPHENPLDEVRNEAA